MSCFMEEENVNLQCPELKAPNIMGKDVSIF